jgi:hypothetical protein
VVPLPMVVRHELVQSAAEPPLPEEDQVGGAGEFHPHALSEPYVNLSAHWPTLPSKERDKSLGGGIPRYGSARDRGSYGLLAIAFLGAGAADGGW